MTGMWNPDAMRWVDAALPSNAELIEESRRQVRKLVDAGVEVPDEALADAIGASAGLGDERRFPSRRGVMFFDRVPAETMHRIFRSGHRGWRLQAYCSAGACW